MYEQIPGELKQLRQWCYCGYDKIPMNPLTGKRASPTNPNTWASFDEAVEASTAAIGFVLTPQDPYCVIDLDYSSDPEIIRRQAKIEEIFDSYTELSLSGKGKHIVIRAAVPSGARRDKVEVYSQDRFIIFTGKVIKDLPIGERPALAEQLYNEMGASRVVQLLEEITDEPMSDQDLVDMATYASNGDKFLSLCQGHWEGEYPSQSEADLALLSIFAFYTKSNDQVRRLFRMSNLGKREKAQRNNTYIDYALQRIRANQVTEIEVADVPVIRTAPAPLLPAISFPPGLIGEMATFIYQNATRPVPEIALSAALALLAGIGGRSYNISGTGLNQYLILLAKTGVGKEGAAQGIDKLIDAVKLKIPTVDRCLGPSAFASGQALIRSLENQNCFVSILGEVGLTLQQISSPKASSAEVMLKKVLLDLYNKSGHGRVLRASVYSNTEKNTEMVLSPSVTIFGESTPSAFYEAMTTDLISQGLIPRFTIIEYTGDRPPRNPHSDLQPPADLVDKLTQYAAQALQLQAQNQVVPVITKADAQVRLDTFDSECDARIIESPSEAIVQIWNRAHLKALKLAALVATANNPVHPTLELWMANWAIDLVHRDIDSLQSKFEDGEIGKAANGNATESQLENEVRRWIELYLELDLKSRTHYKIPVKVAHTNYVPFTYLRRRARLSAPFQKDLRGIAKALQDTLEDLDKGGILIKMDLVKAANEFATKSPLYYIGPSW